MYRFLWFVLCVVSAWAFEVTLDPHEIGLDEVATLVISHTEAIEVSNFPQVEGLRIQYEGVSQFSSLEIINGKMTSTRSYQYRYALFPLREGKFTLPSFEVRDKKNQVYRTDPLVLRVVKKRKQKVSSSPTTEYVLPRMWYELVPERSSAFQNERVILTGYLVADQKEALFYPLQEVRPLVADNCLLYDGTSFLSSGVEKRGGYWAKPVHQWVLFGIEPGLLAIAPPQLIAVSPIGQVSIPTENIALDIKRQDLFLYRGRLEAKEDPLPSVVTQGESVEYRIVFRGNGNLSLFSDIFHGVSLSHVSFAPVKVSHGLSNWKREPEFFQELSYQITFLEEGVYELPERELSYLDERGGKRRLLLPRKRIQVVPKKTSYEGFSPLVLKTRQEITYVGGMWFFWFLMIGVVILPWGWVWWKRHEKRMGEDRIYAGFVRSVTQMDSYFSSVNEAMSKQQTKRFAQELYRALWNFLCDREKLSRHMDRNSLVQELLKRGFSEEEIREIEGIFRTLEAMAYAPGVSSASLHEVYEKTMSMLREHYRFL
ncbi:MAG: BatD family protein [Brevinematales bacterium]|nr:BatD family protein [Brevinematales bacterium]